MFTSFSGFDSGYASPSSAIVSLDCFTNPHYYCKPLKSTDKCISRRKLQFCPCSATVPNKRSFSDECTTSTDSSMCSSIASRLRNMADEFDKEFTEDFEVSMMSKLLRFPAIYHVFRAFS
ncbi:hypothetical protein AB6A40_004047 [Gnathostoma spinigerum]|uniref:Uncharacterized protein n=1 Tax=Gnathostoma spinigerum TaxID=75299 RepID=A0ABD6EK45_9BILA